ncbi:MAG: MoxR family ATPase [Pseudobacteriovorax sp.]|nr:MoxR family ATPase [Pseudobacteriovorax sp.]
MSQTFTDSQEYVASPELTEIVNIALDLEKPLIIRGEPGTGKTLLAKAAANVLGRDLLTWHVKSTTKAQDGLYVYDTVQRLNDSRFGDNDVSDISQYIKLGPLGLAFQSEQPVVVLIDEVDKADIEFPNDLLHELDAMSFLVSETGKTITAKHRPLIIITSNAEKELPDAFLRRCLFHYISFPDKSLMTEIIKVHYPDLEKNLLAQVLEAFYALRDFEGISKPPSTSELIDWISALRKSGIAPKQLQKSIPFLGVLIKKEEDLKALQQPVKKRGWSGVFRLFFIVEEPKSSGIS